MENFGFTFMPNEGMESYADKFVMHDSQRFVMQMDDRNVLSRIRIGEQDEIKQVRKLAREIVSPMGYTPNWEPLVIQCLSVLFLHFLYVYVNGDTVLQKTKGPWLETIRTYLFSAFVEEEMTDEEGMPVYDEDTGLLQLVIKEKPFDGFLPKIINYCHIPYEGLIVSYPDKDVVINRESIQSMYAYEPDIYEVAPDVHPWIHRNAVAMLNTGELTSAASMAAAAIEKYIEDNDCQFELNA